MDAVVATTKKSERNMRQKSDTFQWTDKTTAAALALAQGKTRQEAAAAARVHRATVQRWLDISEFSAEVDRLSLMVDIASRAERLRIAKRAVRQMIDEETGRVKTERDLLDWLKFAQSETDGVRLDLARLAAALGTDAASVAD